MSVHGQLDNRLALNAATEMARSLTSESPMSSELRGWIWDDLEDELARCRLTLGEALRLYANEREAARYQTSTASSTRPEEV